MDRRGEEPPVALAPELGERAADALQRIGGEGKAVLGPRERAARPRMAEEPPREGGRGGRQPSTTATALPRHLQTHRRRRLAGRRRALVHDGDVARIQAEEVAARADGDRIVGQSDSPDEARRRDASGEVVRARARTGLEQIDSDEAERPPALYPVGRHVVAHEDADVVHDGERAPGGIARRPPHVGEHDDALEVAKSLTDLPIVAQKAFAEDGSILSGSFPIDVINHLIDQGADVVGANCTVGPQRMFSIIRNVHKDGVILSAQPAAGIPTLLNGRSIYHTTPAYLASYARELVESGVTLIGACCGSTPEHIRAIAETVKGLKVGHSLPRAEAKSREKIHAEPEPKYYVEASRWSRFSRNVGPRRDFFCR